MTPKMLIALREAGNADRTGGLHRSRAGWSVEGTFHWHNFRTVTALIDRGYLDVFGGSKGLQPYACVTELGFSALLREGYDRDGSMQDKEGVQ